MSRKLRTFKIITDIGLGKNIFLTKAKDTKNALSNLILYSKDYEHLLKRHQSDVMNIKIKLIK